MVDSRGTVNQTIQYMQHNGMPGAHAPINRELLALGEDCLAQCVYEKISLWASTAEAVHLWNNWQVCICVCISLECSHPVYLWQLCD